MNIVKATAFLFASVFISSAQAQTFNFNFNNIGEGSKDSQYTDAGKSPGQVNSDFEVGIGGATIKTGGGTFSGGETGGLLITQDSYYAPIDLSAAGAVTISGRFNTFDGGLNGTGRVDSTFFGLTQGSDALTMLGTGFSDNSGSSTGPGNTYWGGAFQTPLNSTDFNLFTRQYDDPSNTFLQSVFNGANISGDVNFSVELLYNGVNSLTVTTRLFNTTVGRPQVFSTARTYGGVTPSEVDTLRPFIYMPGGLGDGFSRGGALLQAATISAVPEPSSALLGLLGAMGLMVRRKR